MVIDLQPGQLLLHGITFEVALILGPTRINGMDLMAILIAGKLMTTYVLTHTAMARDWELL